MNEEEAGGYTGTGVTKPCVTAAHSWTGVEEWESVGRAWREEGSYKWLPLWAKYSIS